MSHDVDERRPHEPISALDAAKQRVHDFWNRASCGEELLLAGEGAEAYELQRRERYRLEPYIAEFVEFSRWSGRRVLEIGVGLGADHQSFAAAHADLHGIDLTERAVEHTAARLSKLGLRSDLRVADAETLPYPDDHFDLVYSWGVLHHSPDTRRAVDEVWRVLRPGATAKLMIYHTWSLVGFMLWARYGLLQGRPARPLADIYAHHLESPGTKTYTLQEARALCSKFSTVEIDTVLTHGDLLASGAGQRHQGLALDIARRVWPRRLLRRLFPKNGLFMLITATK